MGDMGKEKTDDWGRPGLSSIEDRDAQPCYKVG